MTVNLICDLDGVVYRGSGAIPGATEALELAATAGANLLFCTNNSSRTRPQVAERIRHVTGFGARAEQVVGSAEAAAFLLQPSRPRTFVLGGEGVVDELQRIGINIGAEGAEAVVVGIDVDLTYDRLRSAAMLVADGARFIATNDDPTYPAEDGFWPGAGSILAAVETASGRRAEVAGKPHRPMRELLRAKLVPGPVWVVGDRPDTDLALAAGEPDWRSILVLTGVVSDASEPVEPPPDLVARDLREAVDTVLRRA